MLVSFLIAVYFELIHKQLGFSPIEDWIKFLVAVIITTFSWLLASYISKPTDKKTLIEFYKLIRPGGPGWKKILKENRTELKDLSKIKWDLPGSIISVFLGCLTIYSLLFTIGFWLYANNSFAIITSITAVISAIGLIYNIKRQKENIFKKYY